MEPEFESSAKLWKYQVEKAAWMFLTINKELSTTIKSFQGKRRGFGSVRVEVTIGSTTWKTSLFPVKEGVYYLPVKKAVRASEKFGENDTVKFKFKLI